MPTGEIIRHPLTVRTITVDQVTEVVPTMRRITFTGDDLVGFQALGPTDHIKVFFPDPATGVLTPPVQTGDGSIQRPNHAVSFNRDYTPLSIEAQPDGQYQLTIDFLLHPGTGLASAWAAQASAGQQLAFVGPRGSRLAPDQLERAVLVADETALPAYTRWLHLLPADTSIQSILLVEDEEFEAYLTPEQVNRGHIEWLYRIDGPGQLDEAVRSLNLESGTLAWAAGEATELVSIRRFLRHESPLEREDIQVQGYWKRGVMNLDHHAPIDPSDP